MRGWTLLVLAACAPAPPLVSGQPPVSAYLVVHVDPLPLNAVECTNPNLESCGTLSASTWVERTDNLEWLVQRWLETGRTMDMELGPEAALAWSGDAAVSAAMEAALTEAGEADPAGLVQATGALAREQLSDLLAGGAGSLGVHVHAVLPDDVAGVWGSVSYNAGDSGDSGTPEACRAWAGEPVTEVRPEMVEAVVGYGVSAAAGLAEVLGAPLDSFTGHLPRSMAGKISLLDDPDGLNPEVETIFSDRFAPMGLGSAYSECLTVGVDHPPFESWGADGEQALLAGDGPPVTPGARVVGSMAKHLGASNDGSLEAAARRLLHQLVVWRYAGLRGDPPRPWVFTFHEHLFDLYPGTPDRRIPEERTVRPQEGQQYRGDVDGLAGLVDAFASRGAWQGVAAEGGGVARWVTARDVYSQGSMFSYGQAGEAPPEGMDRERYPYLPLLAERLVDTHLACAGEEDGVEIYGLLRCEGGWSWGDPDPGYGCADGAAPAWVYLLVPEGPRCLDAPEGAATGGAVDDDALAPLERCGGGLAVPEQGLILEPATGPWWADLCGAWP